MTEECLRTKFDEMSKEISRGCGLVYELYQTRLSAEIDNYIKTLPQDLHDKAYAIAKNEFDYICHSEKEEKPSWQDGLCLHGLDPNCCPCGCGDL